MSREEQKNPSPSITASDIANWQTQLQQRIKKSQTFLSLASSKVMPGSQTATVFLSRDVSNLITKFYSNWPNNSY